RLTEMLCVDPIHRGEVADVGEIHAGARDVIEAPAGRLENRCEVPKDPLGLGHDAARDDLAGGRVLADLTTEVEEAADFDCLGKRADRRREFGRGHCSLAHGNSVSIRGGKSLSSLAVFENRASVRRPPCRRSLLSSWIDTSASALFSQ